MLNFIAQIDLTALEFITQHGPLAVVVIAGIIIIAWWIRYVAAPKAKQELENSSKVADRQIHFIDNVEALLANQVEALTKMAELHRDELKMSESINKHITLQDKQLQAIITVICLMGDLWRDGSATAEQIADYAARIREELR